MALGVIVTSSDVDLTLSDRWVLSQIPRQNRPDEMEVEFLKWYFSWDCGSVHERCNRPQ